ncbi:MAG: TonB-dependent receptor [Gammaproteobacteria bacterium]|nr:TonB-dependent receptor [Gammaproteobacteria bacterium]
MKTYFRYLRHIPSLALVAILSFCFMGGGVSAQEVGEATADPNDEIEELTVVGSRRLDRSAADSPVPVDVIDGEDMLAYGANDMDELLSIAVPSYNVGIEPISDAATFIRPAMLRSLAPDATLVLVNGKRRHRAAVIALLGAGAAGGAQAPDLSAIPAIALKRVEVLRDGASAQYGSDAIAGIINLVLRDSSDGITIDSKIGQHYEGDGQQLSVAANIGLPMTDLGFANLSFEWKENTATSRSQQRGDAQGLIDAGNSHVRQPAAQIWGSPDIYDDFKLFGNFGLDINPSTEVYAFGNWSEREVVGGFYFRNPHTRNGVFRGPIVDGVPTVKVADLTGDMSGNCPVVPIINNVPDADVLAGLRTNPDCYSLIEKFPGGFTPNFGGQVADMSIAGGFRGHLDNGWYYDFSATVGRSYALFYIFNTINPQLLTLRNDIPTHYEAGAYTETDRVFNFGMSKQQMLDNGIPLNIAWGLEYRTEMFRITNGEPNSFHINESLAAQGFGVGSNGFAGFPPSDAGISTVSAQSAYIDLESDVSDELLVGGALRFERWPDYGNTLDGKVAFRYDVNSEVAVRGAVSTGFRVPTAGQANLRNVTTEFNMGALADIATLPPTNPVAQQKGATALTPEKSVNLTFGVVASVRDIDVTVDYYSIEVEDRIAFTSRFNLTPQDIEALLAAGVADATSFSSVRFFSNQQTLRSSGIDVVASMPIELMDGTTTVTVAANFGDVELESFNPEFTSENRRKQIEDGQPGSKISATMNHDQGQWSAMLRVRYYGEHYDSPTNDGSVSYYPDPAFLLDAEVRYQVDDNFTVTGGLQNLSDVYPSDNPAGEVAGLIYAEQSPYGFNGGYYYARVTWRR